MIHPDTRLRFINEDIGLGVFATRTIPRGTITYIEDPLERVVSPDEFQQLPRDIQQKVVTYSYRNEHGNRIVSWDHAKYVNHSCDCNTISTGYGFEIAVKDIQQGEQITDEYALFNLEEEMLCRCGADNCRTVIRTDSFCLLSEQWDNLIKQSLEWLPRVEQPLMHLMDSETRQHLCQFFKDPYCYKSVSALRYVDRSHDDYSV